MQKIITTADMRNAIQQLEYQKANEWLALKEQVHITCENLKPFNIIKNTFKEMTFSPDIKDNLISTIMGLTAGYLSKTLIVGASHNPIKKLFGVFLQVGISSFVSKNSETIKALSENIISCFSKKNVENG